VTAFVMAPLIAWATQGRYYLARRVIPILPTAEVRADGGPDGGPVGGPIDGTGPYRRLTPALTRCCICERDYEADDLAQCPAYQAPICSLCCTLDARCNDLCKPQARLSAQWLALLQRLLPQRWAPQLEAGLAHWLLLAGLGLPVLALLLGGAYQQGQRVLGAQAEALAPALWQGVLNVGLVLALLGGIVAWWLVLAHRSRLVAQEESQRQTEALQAEIERHRRTDAALQSAKAAAEAANQAKSRYVTAISHELRTPLNSILGYAQLLEEDPAMPPQRRQAVQVIRRGGDHLLGLIEGTLDLARIEAGKLALQVEPMRLREGLEEIARLMELQAAAKGVRFVRAFEGTVPEWVRADERRLRQILINLLGNAVKFTSRGEVTFRVRFAADMARFEIADTGPGMGADELARVFEPFQRGAAQGSAGAAGGTGLGLTISRMLAELMGGELTARSTPGEGSVFSVKLFLPEAPAPASTASGPRLGHAGPRRRILVVDNEEADRTLMADLLQPLGFLIEGAASGEAALARLADSALPVPDAIFMDLAMPGIDGWETIRRLRAVGHGDIPLAVVSANAFDRGLDHDVALAADDFLVKPVRLTRLLDWLGDRLALAWTAAPANAAEPAAVAAPEALPDAQALQDLQRLIDQGWMRGIQRKLDQIEAADVAAQRFVARLRGLAQRFEMNALQAAVGRALDEHRSR
ncbi:MAG: response regulator, partial [Burkholderiaceae bacterium]|nr:response regulator [Burkholderiaceae bacterium]